MTHALDAAKAWAKRIKRDIVALWIAARDPRTPFAAKLLAAVVAAYALSPMDLIPDFIPILGYLDDILLVPLGILLAVRLIPHDLMTQFRLAAEAQLDRPTSKAGLIAIIIIWLAATALLAWLLFGRMA